jgi:prepilin-type N-terminal cleavage/methylation domain-containing protein
MIKQVNAFDNSPHREVGVRVAGGLNPHLAMAARGRCVVLRRAFTLIELLVVISIIALLIAILLPALSSARLQAQILQSATHMRGTHQAFVLYAEEHAGLFPGLIRNGSAANPLPASINGQFTSPSRENGEWPSTRFGLIIEDDYVSPEYMINPADPAQREAWTFGPTGLDSAGTPLDYRNFSYAVQQWNDNPENRTYLRKQHQLDNLNAQMPVVGDRVIVVIGQNYADPNAYLGVYSPRAGEFRMGMAWGDGHTTIESSAELTTRFGQYTNKRDNIYQRVVIEADIETSPNPPTGWDVQAKFCYSSNWSHQSPPSEWP